MNFIGFTLTQKHLKILLFSYCLSLSLVLPYLLYISGKVIFAVLLSPLVLILLLDNFHRYIKVGLISTMFISTYINTVARIQIVNLFSYILILYFLINYNKDVFNKFKLPSSIKYSSMFLIIAVILSAINSPFASIKSIYYGLMFFIYIFTSYIVFKNIFEVNEISNYLKNFIYACCICGIIIMFDILISGNLRSRGITGPTFSDIIVSALLIVIFKYLFYEEHRYIYYPITIILVIILIADQSRFAWVGFLLALVYGLFLTLFYPSSKAIKRRIIYLLISIFVLFFFVFISGLYKIILERFSDVSFSILQSSEQKDLIGNSLDMRGLIWLTALSAFVNNPWTGVGYFMFYDVSYHYNILPDFIYYNFVYGLDAHSTLMNFLCETGIIGFISIITFFIVIYTFSFKSLRISITPSEISLSLVLNILVFFIETTSIYAGCYTFGYNGYFLYFIFALVISNYILLKKRRNEHQTSLMNLS